MGVEDGKAGWLAFFSLQELAVVIIEILILFWVNEGLERVMTLVLQCYFNISCLNLVSSDV